MKRIYEVAFVLGENTEPILLKVVDGAGLTSEEIVAQCRQSLIFAVQDCTEVTVERLKK